MLLGWFVILLVALVGFLLAWELKRCCKGHLVQFLFDSREGRRTIIIFVDKVSGFYWA